jgi:hypothetical protein
MQEWLTDPEAPWWVKLRRAAVRIDEVRQRAAELDNGEAWSIEREPVDADGWAYRFRIHRAAPAELAAAVGDAVANMRAALDYVAYELARHHLAEMGNEMGDEEEAATSFPICIDEDRFKEFMRGGKRNIRATLYGDVERKALRCVQPFALSAEAREVGVEPSTDAREDLLTDHAYVLNAIWNIDKHRRLPRLAWANSDLVYWSQAEVDYRWVRRVAKLAPLVDGTVLGELHSPPGAGRPQNDACFDVHLVMRDDPSPYAAPLERLLERLHQSLVQWVVPRVFIVANGNRPPMMISFSAPT